jgi:hypothetical protein
MRGLLLFLSLLLGWTTAAPAASCLEETERLAARYKLTFFAPMTSPQGGVPAAPSGEVPPATADARGALAAPDTRIEPGATAPPARSAPGAAPGSALDGAPAPAQTGSGSSTPAVEPPPLEPTQRARMEKLLSQARAAESAGRSDECFRELREAQTIATSGR